MNKNESARALLAKAANTHSQTGEDGIIAAILDGVPDRDNWCVEFGAWDGKHLSNTYRLIEEEGFSAVLIEGNKGKSEELRANMAQFANITCINAFVGFTPADGLDALLAETDCPKDFDFLSVDIDGNDYHVIAAMNDYRPKLICVEYNPTVPSPILYVQPADPAIQRGNSLRAFYELGAEKGYRLVCANWFNAFLVREDLWRADYAKSVDEITEFRETEPPHCVLFNGYDGHVMVSQPYEMAWHKYTITEKDLQVVPWSVRSFPTYHNPLQRAYSGLRRAIRRMLRGG